jgi:hypothetical protein
MQIGIPAAIRTETHDETQPVFEIEFKPEYIETYVECQAEMQADFRMNAYGSPNRNAHQYPKPGLGSDSNSDTQNDVHTDLQI